MARAASSLPVPLSPRRWTQASDGATTAIRLKTSCMARRVADDRLRRPTCERPASRFGRRRPALDRALDRPLGRGQIERLQQILEGPVADGLHRRGQVAEGRDDDDRHGPSGLAESAPWPQPLMPGRRTSSTIASGRCAGAASSPCSAEAAVAALWPSDSASLASPQQMLGSSSTINRWAMGRGWRLGKLGKGRLGESVGNSTVETRFAVVALPADRA